MDAARKIADDGELGRIAAAGAGFVADPFNRRWHLAACPRVGRMTAGEPKWFASTRPTLDAYLRQRLAQYPTAKPILPCTKCVKNEEPLPSRCRVRRRLARWMRDHGSR